MFRKMPAIFFFVTLLCPAIFAQPAGEKRWEYKIIGLFETDQLGPLGLRGWEVAVFTTLGEGNGQIILKRVYDLERTKREAGEDARKAPTPVKPSEFIDLDAQAEKNAIQAKLKQAEERLEKALRGVKGVSLTIDKIKALGLYDSKNTPRLEADVVLDGNPLLSQGNQYKGSEARAYLEKAAKDVLAQIGLISDYPYFAGSDFQHRSKVELHFVLKIGQGSSAQTIAQGLVAGQWPE